jgi:hypothetical protein
MHHTATILIFLVAVPVVALGRPETKLGCGHKPVVFTPSPDFTQLIPQQNLLHHATSSGTTVFFYLHRTLLEAPSFAMAAFQF